MFNLKKMEQFLNLVSVGCKKRKVRLIKITSSIYCHSVVILFQCVPKYKKNPQPKGWGQPHNLKEKKHDFFY